MAQPSGRIVWEPQPGPQTTYLRCTVPDIFYGGARGGGKTDGTLGKWLKHEEKHGWKAHGIVFRRSMPELEEFQKRCRQILPALGYTYQVQARTWVSKHNASLKLRFLEHDSDAWRYQGHQYTFMAFEELTNWPNPQPIDELRACLRSPHGIPCEFVATGNPGGIGHNWVKKRYVDPAEPGKVFYDAEARIHRIFIPARLEDNRLLTINDPEYADRLYSATIGQPWKRKNWLEGDWNAIPDIQPFPHVLYHDGETPEGLRLFWCVDMAYTKKKNSDYTASGIWGVDSGWIPYELAYWEKQADAPERINHVFDTMRLWQPRGLDVMFLEAHTDWFQTILPQEMYRRKFEFHVEPLSPQGVPKDDRIRDNLSRYIETMRFMPGSKLAQRVVNYMGGRDVNGEPDDGPDMLAYVCMEIAKAARVRPPEQVYDAQTAYKIRAREKLMRDSGRRSFEVVR